MIRLAQIIWNVPFTEKYKISFKLQYFQNSEKTIKQKLMLKANMKYIEKLWGLQDNVLKLSFR